MRSYTKKEIDELVFKYVFNLSRELDSILTCDNSSANFYIGNFFDWLEKMENRGQIENLLKIKVCDRELDYCYCGDRCNSKYFIAKIFHYKENDFSIYQPITVQCVKCKKEHLVYHNKK